MTARPPRTKRWRNCLTCGARLERKRTGRPARYCSDRCRDKAYEGRNFKAVRRNSRKNLETSITCRGVFADRGSVFSVPLDLIGHAGFRFESPRFDPTVVRTILENELGETEQQTGGER